MSNTAVTLHFKPFKSCFIALSIKLREFYKASEPSVFEVQGEAGGPVYLTQSGDVCSDGEHGVGINGLLASKQGFTHGQQVTMRKVENVETCVKACVEPLSVDDWEILPRSFWSESEELALAELLPRYPTLWDHTSQLYWKKDLKAQLYSQVAERLNKHPEDVRHKLHNWRTQYPRAKRSKPAYGGVGVKRKKEKWLLKHLAFLDPVCHLRAGSERKGADTESASEEGGDFDLNTEEISNTVHVKQEVTSEGSLAEPLAHNLMVTESYANNHIGNNHMVADSSGYNHTVTESISNNHIQTGVSGNNHIVPGPMNNHHLTALPCEESFGLLNNMRHRECCRSGSSEDMFDRFGAFVADELRQIPSEKGRKMAKRQILQILMDFSEYSETDVTVPELHAEEIESGLLNQVRVVSPGMVVPVWVQKSTCIFVKIGDVEPPAKCCLLAERTEVHIIPKDRKSHIPLPVQSSAQSGAVAINTSATQKPKPRKSVEFSSEVEKWPPDSDSRSDRDTPSPEQSGLLSNVLGYLRSWWEGKADENDLESGTEVAEDQQEDYFLSCDWCTGLRVQPMGNFRESYAEVGQSADSADQNVPEVNPVNLSQHPTNVFVSRSTFERCLKPGVCEGSDDITGTLSRSFLAELSCMISPREKADRLKRRLERRSHKSRVSREASELEEADTEAEEEGGAERTVVVRVIVLDRQHRHVVTATSGAVVGFASLSDDHGVHDDHVMLSDELRRQMGAEVTGRVLLRSLSANRSSTHTTAITLYPLFAMPGGFDVDMLKLAVKSWVSHHTGARAHLIVSMATLLRVPLRAELDGEFLVCFEGSPPHQTPDPACPPYVSLDRVTLERACLHVEKQLTEETRPQHIHRLPYYQVTQIDPKVTGVKLEHLGGISDISSNSLAHIQQCLCLSPMKRGLFGLTPGVASGGVLVTGPKGVGKSSLVKALCDKLSGKPWYAYTTVIECKQLRGKRVDNIKKAFEKVLSEAAWRQPSLVVLDDLHLISGAPAGPEQEMSGDAIYFTRVAQVLCDLLKAERRENSRICVVATCRSRSSLHKSFSSSKGAHYFQQVVEMQPPDKTARGEMLACIIRGQDSVDPDCLHGLDLTQLAARTEGFVARDLETVVRRALHAHSVVHTADLAEISLTPADFEAALVGFTPSSLKSVSLHTPSELGWSDIGGLQEVKHTLVQTLQWPAKYPDLFASCPLRLRSGLLLYGAPGTGKTLLASAVAKECGLNFISIKGPELLSKYIGASEQAVRDTFLRAQSAKPCILFFDEFDSLAPRRGHDSTGVTDRVVNQLLTQLDGVEGLEGVYVLGATSRPDLIDPALLRPGRLDKSLHCTIPTQEERSEILRAMTRHMDLHTDVDLDLLSSKTDHFTGADFKALLYNAQLEAIHERHGNMLAATGLRFTGDGGREATEEQNCDSNGVIKRGVSEGSVLSNGSWETVNMPHTGEDSAHVPGHEVTSAHVPGDEVTSAHVPGDEVTSAHALVVERDPSTQQTDNQEGLEGSRSFTGSERMRLGYIPSLEQGMVEMSEQTEEKLRRQVLQLMESGDVSDDNKRQAGSSSTVLEQRHLVSALHNMGPSVSGAERTRYNLIYQNFVSSKGGNFNEGIQSAGKRATLA